MSRVRTKEGWEDIEGVRKGGFIPAEGEFGRGETERERGGGNETKGEESSPLADYVPNPPRSFTPAMFFLLLPLSSATADDLAGLRRAHPRAFRLAPKPPSPRGQTWQVPTTPAPVWTVARTLSVFGRRRADFVD